MSQKKGKAMSKKKKVILGITGGFLLLLIVGGLLISREIGRQMGEGPLHSNDGNDTKANSVNQLSEWGYDLAAFQQEWPEENSKLTSADGVEIPVSVYRPQTDAVGSVILIHGHGGDHVSVAPLAEIYLRNGYVVYALDQRGSGDSPDPLVYFGYVEKQDIAAVVDYARQQSPELPVVVHGQSMGAVTAALYAAGEHGQNNLDALILDSAFEAMEPMVLGVIEMDGLAGWYFARCGDWYLKSEYGFGFRDVDTVKQASDIITPALVIQCERDELVPVTVGEAIHAELSSPVKSYWLADSEHIEALIDYPEEYETRMTEFLAEALAE